MKIFTPEQLSEILDKHKLWLNGDEDGERANLSSANLRYASLSSANLRFISSADGSVLACINTGKYQVVAASDRIAIGCQMHSVEDWFNFDDDKISRMDDGALEWWNQWKELVFAFHRTSPWKPPLFKGWRKRRIFKNISLINLIFKTI